MALVAADIVVYASSGSGSANPAAVGTPVADTGTSGGAIDGRRRVSFTDLQSASTVRVRSDGADTRKVFIQGRLASGTVATETLTLAGTSNITSANTYNEIMFVEARDNATGNTAESSATRSVIMETSAGGNANIGTIPINEFAFVRYFRFASADGTTVRYEKCFVKNNSATNALLSALFTENTGVGGAFGSLSFALANAFNDVVSVANRTVAPTGATSFLDTSMLLNTATGTPDLGVGQTIGVWLRLNAGSTAIPATVGQGFYPITASGNTTA